MADIRMITDIRDPALDVYSRTPEVQLLRLFEPKSGDFYRRKSKGSPARSGRSYEPYLFWQKKGKWKVRLMRSLSGAGIFRFIWQNRMYLRDLRALSLQEDFYVL